MFTDYAIQTLHRQRSERLSALAHKADRDGNAARQRRASRPRHSSPDRVRTPSPTAKRATA